MPRSLLLVFFLFSGAFSLVYELSWVRLLTVVFGSTVLSASTVISVYMGGLGLGALIAGKHTHRITNPLMVYGTIEIALGCYALSTPLLFQLVLPIFDQLQPDTILALSLTRFTVSGMLLLPPTLLMGATLPVLAKMFSKLNSAASSTGELYAINTIGGVMGTVLAGFLLLPVLGIETTIYGVAVLNVAVGFAAAWFSSNIKREEHKGAPLTSPPVIMLSAVMLIGFSSLVAEIAWTRVVSLVIGSSVYSIVIVLAVFLVGLGIGSWVSARRMSQVTHSAAQNLFFYLSLAAGVSIALTSASFGALPELFRNLFWHTSLSTSFVALVAFETLIVAVIMLVPTLVMGSLFPVALRAISSNSELISNDVSRLYLANTIGAVAGSFLAGFFLISLLGIRMTLMLAALTAILAGLISCFVNRAYLYQLAAIGVGAIVLVAMPSWDQQVLTSAMYKYADQFEVVLSSQAVRQRKSLLYYKDGRSATITVTRDLHSEYENLYLSTNGKVDGSSYFDMSTQRMLAHVPLLIHEAPRRVCMIGLGTGVSAGSAALHETVDTVSVVEIEPAVAEAATFFTSVNHDVLNNEKVSLHLTDGRLYLRLNPDSCDVIISEPSNPWLAGTTNLYTQEFFQLAARSLSHRGAFSQWIQLYGLSPENLQTLIRTFTTVFPYTYIFTTLADTDILLLGFEEPTGINIAQIDERLRDSRIAQDLAETVGGVNSVFELLARMRLGPKATTMLASGGEINTDDQPIIVYNAVKDLYKDTRKSNSQFISGFADGICPGFRAFAGPDYNFLFAELQQAYQDYLGESPESINCAELIR